MMVNEGFRVKNLMTGWKAGVCRVCVHMSGRVKTHATCAYPHEGCHLVFTIWMHYMVGRRFR